MNGTHELSTHLVDVKLALASRQLSVAGGKLADKIMTEEKSQMNRINVIKLGINLHSVTGQLCVLYVDSASPQQ